MILEVELIPSTAFYSNVRALVKTKQWNLLKKDVYEKAGHCCEICKSDGLKQYYKWPVECHEIWDWDEKTGIQKLVRLIALCPLCHASIHYGISQILGKEKRVRGHLIKVNGITEAELNNHLEQAFETFQRRSLLNWTIDITLLNL